MIEPNRPAANASPATFEMRPNPNRHLNADAPDDIVLPASGQNSSGSFFDYINPLQHLPIVGTLYRAVTGATISPSARIVGGLLYGGPIGFASSLANAVVETASGKDIGEHAMAAVGIGGSRSRFPTLDTSSNFAQAAPPPPPQNVDARTMAALGGGGLQFASAGGDSDSMLATWIAGPGQEFARNVAQTPALPTRAAPAPTQVAAAPAPIQPTAPNPTGGGDNNRSAGNAPMGRSLVEYRASAINTSASFRGLGPAGPSGVSRMPASPIQPASLQTQPSSRANAGENVFSAQVQTQLQAQDQRDTGEADSYFAAQMAAGLERYSRMQRERLSEGQRL
ncbi:MAG: hypothetical protein ING44_02000 [Telmatospirillum sp.]|nr:hypothetical protein [Telmatospirillum sp.]